MASRLVRSLFWLVACGGVSYGLLILTTPTEEDIRKRKEELLTVKENREHLTKNQQFMDVIISASENKKPIYRLTKEELEREFGKK